MPRMIIPFLFALFFVTAISLEAAPATPKQIFYNYSVSHTHNFVWFRIAKVGTTTLYNILNNNHVELAVNKFHIVYPPKIYKDKFKFVFVRNPWDRIVSCYCNKVVNKCWRPFSECYDKDFDYFVNFVSRHDLTRADRHIRLQSSMFPKNQIDFIGRFENFEHDLRYVLNKIGLQEAEIPKKNSTPHEHYSKYYTERTKKIIAQLYKEDILLFGYKFETE